MDLIEMRKGVWQLGENDLGIAAVHQTHVVPLKGIHEALSDAIRLRAAYRRVDRLDPHLPRQGMRLMGPVGTAIVAQELQFRRAYAWLTKARFDRLHKRVTYGFPRQTAFRPSAPRNDFPVTAILHEHASDDLAVVAGNLEAVRAPAPVRFCHANNAIVHAAADATFRRFRQQKSVLFHHSVKTLVVDRLQAHQGARAVDQGAGPAVAIGRQFRNFGAHRVDQDGVGRLVEGLCRTTIQLIGRPCQH